VEREFAVLVLSCDKYSDVWPAFFRCFWENFPVGDWPVYLASTTKKYDDPRVISLFSGNDTDWSSSYKRILERIPEKKVFVILEDLLLCEKFDPTVLAAIAWFMSEKNANLIKYSANPAPDIPTGMPLIGECLKGAPYRATVCGFWDREYLLKLLIEGESPWNFEIMGSYRTAYSDGIYATTLPYCRNINLIEKGRWVPESVDWAIQRGLPLTLEARPMQKGGGRLISLLQVGVFNLILRIPWRFRVRLMDKLRRLLISY